MNSKSEGTGYPGIVFRKSGNDLEVKSWTDRATKGATSVSSVKIIRVDGKIYYSYNNSSSFTPLNDTSTLNGHPFNLNVRFGCSEQADGTPFRHIKAKLSNFYIKLGTFSFE